MKSGWQIGSVFGIPLLLNSSWFFILALFTLHFGSSWQRQDWGMGAAWIAGFAMALLLFVSVLLHELGHSLVARSQGITVTSITLFLLGGVASIDQESKTPGQAFQVAIAGPAVSFGLCLLLTLIHLIFPLAAPIATVVDTLAGINLVLALFNMIPGLPLDGGQVLKAAIWKITGSRIQGVRWAAQAGQLLGWTAIASGISFYFTSSLSPGWLWIALLGWFGVRNASAYRRVTDLQAVLLRLRANAVMSHDFRVVDASLTVNDFADKYLADQGLAKQDLSGSDLLKATPDVTYFAAAAGRYRGLVTMQEVQQCCRQGQNQTIQDFVRPLSEIPTVEELTPLTQVIAQMEAQALRSIPVLSPAGSVSGVIDRSDIVRAVAQELKVPVANTIIQRIKAEGTYPPGLPLDAIAKAFSE
jgi:Zn-dependent protease/CBS domain-containing protein